MASLPQQATEPRILEAAVAGVFYPADPQVLSKTLDQFLSQAEGGSFGHVRALVCPHAGYAYSGAVAAKAYKQVLGGDFQVVMVLGPSHHAIFSGAAIPDADACRTPLGPMIISPEARKLGRPFAVNPPCQVQRPAWAKPRTGRETPFTWEHSVEVQLPFLQKVLPQAQVVPILCGEMDPREAALELARHLDVRTLLVASSDLSHFHSYAKAQTLDRDCVQAICDLDLRRMKDTEACGKTPITVLMHLAKLKGWHAELLDLRNSGDTGTDKDSVVGYAAIAFYEDDASISAEHRDLLLKLARKTLQSVTQKGGLPPIDAAQVPEPLKQRRACFVTLTKGGDLRGCIGHILPQMPLYQAVMDNARAAALRDSRFPSLKAAEVPEVHIEISVLSLPQPLPFKTPQELLQRLKPRQDGVILKLGARQATFLPQVWEQLPRKESFLTELSLKAGGPADLWKKPGAEVQVYRVEAFEEGGKER